MTGAGPGTDGPAVSSGLTEALGRWVSELSYEDIPDDVLAHAQLCVLDGIGVALYGAAQPWGRMSADLAVEMSAGGPASLFGRAEKVSPPDAALANGTALHGFELDDIHVSSSFHPGCVVIPAAMAVAEARNSSGRQFLASVVAGYEAGIRMGICAGLTHSACGYHMTGTVGAIASAAAAARGLRLDPMRSLHAVAIGATQASGLYAARKGAMAKRFHAGRASQSGVIAALLAEKGFTGSTEAIEAPFGGFLSTLRGQSDPSTVLEALGTRWETPKVGFKVYAACASAHTTIDALHDLMRRGLTADNLQQLTIRMSKKGQTNVGWPYAPNGAVAAQMNGFFTAAVKLLDGETFVEQYREERLADPRILDLIRKIDIVHDPVLDIGGAAKRHAVIVDARLTDGAAMQSSVENRLGSAERPVSASDIEQKFRKLAGTCLSTGVTDDVIGRLERLESESDLTSLMSLLAKRDGGATTLL